jgi:sulfur-oxidizing protein SoxA
MKLIGPLLPLLLVWSPPAMSQANETPRSGYEFMEAATQALQDDDFLNPGFFLVDEGERLWSKPFGPEGKSCGDCHKSIADSMRGVAARYPSFDAELDRLFNLETRLQYEISERMGGPSLPYDAPEILALTAAVSLQSRGMPVIAPADPALEPFVEIGEQIYAQRHGQLNLSCRQCHVDNSGNRLRGDIISEGHINAFPIYRLLWSEPGSRHRMFEWCMQSVRAEPYARGSQEFIALELYLASRGAGLLIEAPGVRR